MIPRLQHKKEAAVLCCTFSGFLIQGSAGESMTQKSISGVEDGKPVKCFKLGHDQHSI